jgi:thioredoxin 1
MNIFGMNMKTCIAIVIFLIILPVSFGQQTSVRNVNSDEFNELISEEKGVLLDVRTASEFKNGHIPDAGNLNYYALDFRKNLKLLPEDRPIYLYCNTGYRSEKAAEILKESGYTRVYNLAPGIMEWEIKHLPVTVEPDARPDNDNSVDPSRYYEIIGSDSLVFIDFYAPWCGPCRKMMPMMDSLKLDYHQEIKMYKINVDASKKLVKELKLISVPYLALFKNGNLLWSHNGSITREELTSILSKSLSKHNLSIARTG